MLARHLPRRPVHLTLIVAQYGNADQMLGQRRRRCASIGTTLIVHRYACLRVCVFARSVTVFPNNVGPTCLVKQRKVRQNIQQQQFCFFVFFLSRKVRIGQLTTYCLVNFFGPVKKLSLQDLQSSDILSWSAVCPTRMITPELWFLPVTLLGCHRHLSSIKSRFTPHAPVTIATSSWCALLTVRSDRHPLSLVELWWT